MAQTAKVYNKWTTEEETVLLNVLLVDKGKKKSFDTVAKKLNRSKSSVMNKWHELKAAGKTKVVKMNTQAGVKRTKKSWTNEEDETLIRYMMAYPTNLKRGFETVSEQTGRTFGAVASHWYTSVSKRPNVNVFFTVSGSHKARNRKNGKGEPSTQGIFKRLLKILGF